MNIEQLTKKNRVKAFRKVYIKRRDAITGLFEDDWFDISKYVKSFGQIKMEVDATRPNKFKFGGITINVQNDRGLFNDENDVDSIWYGYASRNRTLFRVAAGFIDEQEVTTGRWDQRYYPGDEALFDVAIFDESEFATSSNLFVGILLGDIFASSKGEITFQIEPLQAILREYPAQLLTGFTSTGITASQFVTMIRDHTDGGGNYVFRPFFENTTTSWNYTTTSIVYANLNSSGAKDIIDKDVWTVVERLAEVENFMAYVDTDGVFNFRARPSGSATAAWSFYGPGFFNTNYGRTIKDISSYGLRSSKFYSRVQVRWSEADTTTSYATYQSSLTVAGNSSAWNYGLKTYSIDNSWIPNASVAESIASATFNYLSDIKREIEFTTTFIPGLDLLDLITVSYDGSGAAESNTLWDVNNWDEMYWDGSRGDDMKLNNKEFYIISLIQNLDKLETKIIGRES